MPSVLHSSLRGMTVNLKEKTHETFLELRFCSNAGLFNMQIF